MEWHEKTVAEVYAELGTAGEGLAPTEAERRLALHGPNELRRALRRTPLLMFFSQFTDFAILVLIVAAILSGFIGDLTDTIAIGSIVLLNAVIGFSQEYRAERALAALRKMAGQTATVIRGGAPVAVPAAEIVPGDLVLIEAGNVVPADLRLVESARLQADESALTGESFPVEKGTEALSGADLPLGERTNRAYKGTVVTYGRGAGIAVATGMGTELGRIAAMLQEGEETRTPLQKRLATFGRRLALVILLVCAAVFLLGFLQGEPLFFMLLIAIALAVAAIPEALPAVVTISLALGAKKLVRQNALIRRLPAVETLGSVTCICSDKTGTLTRNRMSVTEIHCDGSTRQPGDRADTPSASLLFTAAALCTDVRPDGRGGLLGDPTEKALYEMAAQAGFLKEKLERDHPRIAEIPFDAERKRMSTCHRWGNRTISFTKGAVETVLPRASGVLIDGRVEGNGGNDLLATAEDLAAAGLRVVCLAMREWEELPGEIAPAGIESDLTVLGLVGMRDPLRPEAREAVTFCTGAGITPVMITGDHPVTARVIARELGILADGAGSVMTGSELEELTLDELAKRVGQVRVYARVAPVQKLKIVEALQRRGECVAMTGDGVNDAPALRRADIGIAMGMTGTDVAKEASAMVLLDDNFATIVNAVREGRRIYRNILRFITYSITSNLGTLAATVVAPLVGLQLPLYPAQILWLNLLCDSLPGLALAAEPAERDVMERPPADPTEPVFAGGRGGYVVRHGLLIGAVALGFQAWAMGAGLPWRTMVFTFLVTSRMAVALSVRSDRQTLAEIGPFSNRPLAGAVLATFLLQLAVVYLPPLSNLFGTEPLTWRELVLTFAVGGIVQTAGEGEKLIRRVFQRTRG